MLLGQLFASNVAVLCLVLTFRVLCLLPPPLPFECYDNVSGHTGVLEHISGHRCCDATCRDASNWAASSSPAEKQVWKYRIYSWFNNKVVQIWMSLRIVVNCMNIVYLKCSLGSEKQCLFHSSEFVQTPYYAASSCESSREVIASNGWYVLLSAARSVLLIWMK